MAFRHSTQAEKWLMKYYKRKGIETRAGRADVSPDQRRYNADAEYILNPNAKPRNRWKIAERK